MSSERISEAHKDYNRLATQDTRIATDAARRGVKMSEEEVSDRLKSLGVKQDIKAKYKIEVTFGPGRTAKGPNIVGIMLWESGKRLHGGGDELMFFCKDSTGKTNQGCWGPVKARNGMAAFCSSCNKAIMQGNLTDFKTGRVTTQALANELEKIFHQLEDSADIYLKYHRTDIRVVAQERIKGKDTARRLKGMHVYPLKNILKDTAHGASLNKRFFAFLTS